MDPRSQKAGGMLDRHIYDTGPIADRLVRGQDVRNLRSSSNRTQGRVPTGDPIDKAQEKKIADSVRELEKKMDDTTDKALLDQAREDQKGMSTPKDLEIMSLPTSPGV